MPSPPTERAPVDFRAIIAKLHQYPPVASRPRTIVDVALLNAIEQRSGEPLPALIQEFLCKIGLPSFLEALGQVDLGKDIIAERWEQRWWLRLGAAHDEDEQWPEPWVDLSSGPNPAMSMWVDGLGVVPAACPFRSFADFAVWTLVQGEKLGGYPCCVALIPRDLDTEALLRSQKQVQATLERLALELLVVPQAAHHYYLGPGVLAELELPNEPASWLLTLHCQEEKQLQRYQHILLDNADLKALRLHE